MTRWWKNLRPNRTSKGTFALVTLDGDSRPVLGAWRPFEATQILGGRYWTLSVLRFGVSHRDPRHTLTVRRIELEEALDALDSEDADPAEAAIILRRILAAR